MRVIGVVDLLAGQAVHARAGRRELYAPVRASAGVPIDPGDAVALARTYLTDLGLTELYVADLDAILRRAPVPAPGDSRVSALAALGAPLWLDTGVSSVERARRALDLGAMLVVVGLETLPSYDALARICDAVGGDRVAFSLDLRDGEPIVAGVGVPVDEPASRLAARAADAGVDAVIVLDLARVGTGKGLDLAMIAQVREAAPGRTVIAGGGVRGPADLTRLAEAGCDGVLVATALQDGRLDAEAIAAARRLRPPSDGRNPRHGVGHGSPRR